MAFDRPMSDSLCHCSFFSCEDDTLNVGNQSINQSINIYIYTLLLGQRVSTDCTTGSIDSTQVRSTCSKYQTLRVEFPLMVWGHEAPRLGEWMLERF